MSARIVPARHGLLWLLAGASLLRREPRQLILLAVGYYLIVGFFIKGLHILGALLLPLALPAIGAALANGVRALEEGQKLSTERLKQGLPAARRALLRLGWVQLLGTLLLIGLSILLGNDVRFDDGLTAEELQELTSDMSLLLLAATPLMLAFWFAPLLVLWQGMTAGKALFFSFFACWHNWRAFLVYGLVVALIAGVVPGVLLLLANVWGQPIFTVVSVLVRIVVIFGLAPILICSSYVSWRDVFATPEPATDPVANA